MSNCDERDFAVERKSAQQILSGMRGRRCFCGILREAQNRIALGYSEQKSSFVVK